MKLLSRLELLACKGAGQTESAIWWGKGFGPFWSCAESQDYGNSLHLLESEINAPSDFSNRVKKALGACFTSLPEVEAQLQAFRSPDSSLYQCSQSWAFSVMCQPDKGVSGT